MYRRIINHHKIIKKVDRNFKKTQSIWDTFFHRSKNKSKDFSWGGRTMNPYKDIKIGFLRRPMVQVSICILAILLTMSMGVYSSFFRLDTLNISGLQRIDESEMRGAVEGILAYKSFNIIPQSSYFSADVDEIRNILKERFPIEKIIVRKKFPDMLDIVIEEKISTIIFDSGEYYSYIDLSGKVVEVIRKVGDREWNIETQITTSTNELGEVETHEEIVSKTHIPDVKSIHAQMGTYPVVYLQRAENLEINDQIFNEAQTKVFVDWFNLLSRNSDIPLKYFSVDSDSSELQVRTYEGWYIKTSMDFSPQTSLEKIQALFREGELNRDQLQYIDLRYPDRIFWR
jgi:hypothetical protein